MNNSEIQQFINANQIYGEDLEEEVLLKILLQCSYALDYLHKKQLAYGIKLTDIFIDNDRNIKIDIFNYQNYNKNYNFKDDILFLGKIFHKICFDEKEYNCPKKIYSKN